MTENKTDEREQSTPEVLVRCNDGSEVRTSGLVASVITVTAAPNIVIIISLYLTGVGVAYRVSSKSLVS